MCVDILQDPSSRLRPEEIKGYMNQFATRGLQYLNQLATAPDFPENFSGAQKNRFGNYCRSLIGVCNKIWMRYGREVIFTHIDLMDECQKGVATIGQR